MSLPEIITPIYELVVPSTKKKIKCRPFLVKEQKVLVLAMESEDDVQIIEAIRTILKNCIKTRIKIDDLALFDVEYLFLQIRAKSISEKIEMKVTCPDDGETEVNVNFLVTDVKVQFPDGHSNLIKLENDVTIEMRYPNLDYFSKVNFSPDDIDPYDLVAQCIKNVYVGSESAGTFSFKEAREWLETLTASQFDKVQEFFNTMPTLRHDLKVKNHNTGVTNDIVIEGLVSFFG